MGLEAAGGYLEELRKHAGFSRADLGAAVGVTGDVILGIEEGRAEASGSVLLKIVDLLGGSFMQLLELIRDAQVSAEDGAELARAWAIRPAAMGLDELTPAEETEELLHIALRRTGGDRAAARRLLLRALSNIEASG